MAPPPSQQPQQRLKGILNALSPPTRVVGTLKVADITYDIPTALTPSRLPRASELLDVHDEHVKRDLHFLLQKYVLGQDISLVSQPGPYARRLAMTFARWEQSQS
jgi:von Willebrand factor A domain-containing protein 8